MKKTMFHLMVLASLQPALFLCTSALGASFTVQMSNFTFTPNVLTVTVGDTVTWTNTTIANHTTTSGDTNLCSPFAFWHSGNKGVNGTFTLDTTGFTPGIYTYMCTNHCSIQHMRGTLIINPGANVTPTVTITNPAAGAKFVAPANVTVGADASDSDGSVTNVQFLIGATAVGNSTTVPYSFVSNGLPAGNYTLSAIASDNNGATKTSSVVNITILTNATLTSPSRGADGRFQFTVNGVAGQTYATETSTNLTNWSAILTNLAPADIFNITDSTSTNILQQFYRTRQDLF